MRCFGKAFREVCDTIQDVVKLQRRGAGVCSIEFAILEDPSSRTRGRKNGVDEQGPGLGGESLKCLGTLASPTLSLHPMNIETIAM